MPGSEEGVVDPTLSRFEPEAKVEIPAFKDMGTDQKDYGFDFNDEYIVVSNHRL